MWPLYLMNPSLRNLFMKKLDTGPRRSNHLRERLLTDLGKNRFQLSVAAIVRQRAEASLAIAFFHLN